MWWQHRSRRAGHLAAGPQHGDLTFGKAEKRASLRRPRAFKRAGSGGFELLIGFSSQICVATSTAEPCGGSRAGVGDPSQAWEAGVHVLAGGLSPGGFQDAPFYLLVLGFDTLPLWGTILISVGCAVFCALIVWFFVCPRMKRKIERKYWLETNGVDW